MDTIQQETHTLFEDKYIYPPKEVKIGANVDTISGSIISNIYYVLYIQAKIKN